MSRPTVAAQATPQPTLKTARRTALSFLQRAPGAVTDSEFLRDRWVQGLVAASLIVQLVYILATTNAPLNPDGYLTWSLHFGEWWKSGNAYRTPGYPLIIAVNLKLGLGTTGVKVEQVAMLTALSLMTAWIAYELRGIRAARVAAALYAIYIPLLSYSDTMRVEPFAIPLQVAATICAVQGCRNREQWVRWAVAASVLGAVATIIRPNSLLVLAICGVALLITAPTLRRRLAVIAVMVIPFVVLFGPWVGRNYALDGQTYVLGNAGHMNLALGLHMPFYNFIGEYGPAQHDIQFFGNARPDGFTPGIAAQTPILSTLGHTLDKHFWSFVGSRFVAQFQLWFWPETVTTEGGGSDWVPYPLIMVIHLSILGLGVVGLWRLRGTIYGKLMLASLVLTAVVYLAYAVTPRYALPLFPFFMVGAAAVVDDAWSRTRRRRLVKIGSQSALASLDG